MNSRNLTHRSVSATDRNRKRTSDKAFDAALETLRAAGFSFEVVARCPIDCIFCDEALPAAA